MTTEIRAARRALGLCQCGRPPRRDRKTCAVCAEAQARNGKRFYARHRDRLLRRCKVARYEYLERHADRDFKWLRSAQRTGSPQRFRLWAGAWPTRDEQREALGAMRAEWLMPYRSTPRIPLQHTPFIEPQERPSVRWRHHRAEQIKDADARAVWGAKLVRWWKRRGGRSVTDAIHPITIRHWRRFYALARDPRYGMRWLYIRWWSRGVDGIALVFHAQRSMRITDWQARRYHALLMNASRRLEDTP